MVDKITLQSVATIDNSLISAINNNNAILTTAIDNTLSRDGTSPNQMGSNLDMNNNQIINLPPPSTVNSPARLADITTNPTINLSFPSLIGDVTAPSNNGALTTTIAPAAVTGSKIASNTITNANIVNNTISNANIRQGVARSVIGVTGNATANVADIQGTTRQVLSINTAGTAATFAQPQGDQLLGTATNDNATAGNVGEFISTSLPLGSAVSLTTATTANVTSISLTAGDWDVSGIVGFNFGATTSITLLSSAISTVSLGGGSIALGNANEFSTAPNVMVADTSVNVGPVRLSLATTTTVFLEAFAQFTVSTCKAYGFISARRVR